MISHAKKFLTVIAFAAGFVIGTAFGAASEPQPKSNVYQNGQVLRG